MYQNSYAYYHSTVERVRNLSDSALTDSKKLNMLGNEICTTSVAFLTCVYVSQISFQSKFNFGTVVPVMSGHTGPGKGVRTSQVAARRRDGWAI